MKKIYKIRSFPDKNYRAIYHNGKTLRQQYNSKNPIEELDFPEFYDIKITNNCEGKCHFCLEENTLIKTIDGEKKIKDIVIGDTVINSNTKNMDIITNQVSQLHKRNFEDELYEIELENGKKLNITGNHKVYTNKGWIKAEELQENDEIFYLD